MTRLVAVLATSLAVLGAACRDQTTQHVERAREPRLRTGGAAVCDRDYVGLFLQLPREGGFRLNRVALDSAGLAKWMIASLPKRSVKARLVFVEADSGRLADLRWIIPAIERAGGAAYEADSAAGHACMEVAVLHHESGAPAG